VIVERVVPAKPGDTNWAVRGCQIWQGGSPLQRLRYFGEVFATPSRAAAKPYQDTGSIERHQIGGLTP
jgi:hypothetical protein